MSGPLKRVWRSLRYPRTYRSEREAQDVLVFQIGKVASVAIHQALVRYGFRSHHTHLLGARALGRQAAAAMDPDLTKAQVTEAMAQLQAGVNLTRMVNVYRREASAGRRRLKVVTLTRDPIAWYVSSVVQVFPHFEPEFRDWFERHGARSGANGSIVDAMAALQTASLKLVMESDAEIGRRDYFAHLDAVVAKEGPDARLPRRLALILGRPHAWFDRVFRPVIEVDIFQHRAAIREGHARIVGEFADVLCLRYENLSACGPVFDDFLGVNGFRLQPSNVTDSKGPASEIRAGIKTAWNDVIDRRLRRTRYSRAFGYGSERLKPKSEGGEGDEQAHDHR